jgi:ABC-type multidrug transport system fused ATPase/permease subunit
MVFSFETSGNIGSFSFSVGEITAFIMLVNQFYRPIRTIADRFNTIQMGMVSGKRIFNLIENTEYQEPKIIAKSDINVNEFSVEFNKVNFAYNPGSPILKDISFKVPSGKTMAIVGETGAGKSTIINLISKLYPQFSGQVSIGGSDINDIPLKQLRSWVSVVVQDVFIFSGTLRDNIDLANEYTDTQIKDAIKSLGLEDILLSKGLDYQTGERGSGLSLGEKQLVSFVRALLINPPILILDEATSSIDPATEQIIQETIPKLTKERTSIVIAHRLGTIKNADEILFMSKGKILESGSHEELIEQNGGYKKLYSAYLEQLEIN